MLWSHCDLTYLLFCKYVDYLSREKFICTLTVSNSEVHFVGSEFLLVGTVHVRKLSVIFYLPLLGSVITFKLMTNCLKVLWKLEKKSKMVLEDTRKAFLKVLAKSSIFVYLWECYVGDH